jgi:hypothetical protein
MNEHESAIVFLHWFWSAFFAVFGVYLIWRGTRIGSVRGIYCMMRLTPEDGGDWHDRIEGAIERRGAAEGRPAPIGRWIGGVSLILAAFAATTSVPDALLYALLCLSIALASAAAFLRLRNSQRTRVAVLSVRTVDQVLSPVWFALALASSLSLLTFVNLPHWATPTILVCISSIACVIIAWRLTQLGALLSGQDLPAEQLVDDRLRFHRSSMVLMFAYIQPFVFVTQIFDRAGAAQFATYVICWIAWAAFLIWTVLRQRRALRVA